MRVNLNCQKSSGLNILTEDQFEEIHFASLEILEKIGVNVFEEEALELLKKEGARVKGNRVYISASMVQKALLTAPCRVSMSDRSGKRAMMLEKGRSYYGTGSDTPYTIDINTGNRRIAKKSDVVNFATICDYLENIDFIMSMALASDVPKKNSYIHQFEAMVLNTTKPIVYTAADLKDLKTIVEIAETIAGSPEELAANPFLALYDEPSSPLQHSKEAVEKLLYLAAKKLPIIYIPAVMLGGTGPVTSAGSLVQANCETLSGLVIHQLRSEGAPFIYGAGIPPMDMKTSVCSYASPEEVKNCALMVKMAQYYNLPVFTTSGCSDSHSFDQQAGMEAGFSLLASTLAGGNIIHDLGYIGSGMTSCAEMLLLCNETVSMAKYFLQGLEINRETLALDVIENVGPGGNYFAEKHTFDNFKNHMFFSNIFNRNTYDNWKNEGSNSFDQRANKEIHNILENHKVQELPKDTKNRIKEIVKKRDNE